MRIAPFFIFIYISHLVFFPIASVCPAQKNVIHEKKVISITTSTPIDIDSESTITKKAYLTFDDGPSEYTNDILNTLKEYNIKATFFVNAPSASSPEDIYKTMVNDGHVLGNHTFSHNYKLIYKNENSFFTDFDKMSNYVYEKTGYTMQLLRFPGGSNNLVSNKYGGKDVMKKIIASAQSKGYIYYDWNVSAGGSDLPAKTIQNNIQQQSKNKDTVIILLHDHDKRKQTLLALPGIIEGLEKQGFMFYPLDNNVEPIQFLKP